MIMKESEMKCPIGLRSLTPFLRDDVIYEILIDSRAGNQNSQFRETYEIESPPSLLR